MEQSKEYYAFISYKREDEKWAKWLADELEHYHLPTTLNGKEFPQNLRPIFRDIDELSAGNLPEQIFHALSISKNLVVVCSPRSAKSEWVDKEITDFIKIKGGKSDNIFPFIIEGIPYSKDADKECFPEALRNLPKNEERLGGNINDQGGRNAALVKIIAGMVGIGFDSLWQKYERDRRKKRNLIVAMLTLFLIAVLSVTVYIWQININLTRTNEAKAQAQSRAAAQESEKLIKAGDSYRARQIAAEAYKISPTAEADIALRHAYMQNNAILWGHKGIVYSSTFTPDGKQIVSTSEDRTIRVWDVKTGKNVKVLKDSLEYVMCTEVYDGSILSAAISHDGKFIASSSDDGIIVIWDAYSGKQIKSIYTGCLYITIEFSPDDKCLVSSSSWPGTGSILIWDIETENCDTLAVATDDKGYNSASYSSLNGRNIISASNGNNICIWDVSNKNCLNVLKGHKDEINSVAFSQDGNRIVSASNDSTIRIWDTKTGKQIGNSLRGHTDYVLSAKFSPDGKLIASASNDGTVKLWDAKSGKLINTLMSHNGRVLSVNFSPDGKFITTASNDNSIHIWDVATDAVISTRWLPESDQDDFNYYYSYQESGDFVEFSPDKMYVVWWDDEDFGTLRIYDAQTGKRIQKMKIGGYGRFSFSSDNNYIVSISNDDNVSTWDIKTGNKIQNRIIKNANFILNGKYVVSIDEDEVVRIWDAFTGKLLQTMEKHSNIIGNNDVKISSDGKILMLTSFDDATICIWNAMTGKLLNCMSHDDQILSAKFSLDGKYIISTSIDNTIRIWESSSGKCFKTLGVGVAATDASLISDNNYYIFISSDNTICIGNISSDNYLPIFKANIEDHFSAGFSADGRKILSVFDNGTIKSWRFPPIQDLMDDTRERFKENLLKPEERRKYFLE